jgi:hypothetical protein
MFTTSTKVKASPHPSLMFSANKKLVLAFSSLRADQCKCNLSGQRVQDIEYGSSVHRAASGQSYIFKNYSDQLLGRVHQLKATQVCLDGPVNQDALIRGVLFGWEEMKNGGFWCPLWDVIYQIDSAIFRRSRLLTRICMLRTIHLLLQVFIQISCSVESITYNGTVFCANSRFSEHSNLVSSSVCHALFSTYVAFFNSCHQQTVADYFRSRYFYRLHCLVWFSFF